MNGAIPRLGILASGALGLTVLEAVGEDLDIAFICTDRDSGGIIEYADRIGADLFTGNPRGGAALKALGQVQVDVMISINYLFLVEKDLIDLPSFAAINFHGSLLPRYRGRTPHVWAIINGESKTGVTAHQIVPECDAGDILLQQIVTIGPNDTGADILDQYKALYPKLVMDTLDAIRSGAPFTPQNHEQASYFGRRTPKDGRIQWKWHRERIRNWVRALAPPYPGAFAYCGSTKIGIHWVELSSFGFRDTEPDGLILKVQGNSVFVKVPNGVLEITRYVDPENVLQPGKLLK